MSNRLTLVELLEHSSNCHALHCARESECREMKQLIYHSLLCKQAACRVCVEVNSFIIAHSNSCTRDCCPVMTCSTLRLHALDKERRNCKLSSNSQDLTTLQSLKQKCRPRSGVRTKVRGTYQCGRCGMPKIRPHKCASGSHNHAAMDSDSEEDDETIDTLRSSQNNHAQPSSSIGRHESSTQANIFTRSTTVDVSNRPSAIVLTKKSVGNFAHHRPSAVFLSHQQFASTDSEDSHGSTSTSSSGATNQNDGHNRKRAASPDASRHAPSSKRADTNFSLLHEPEHSALPVSEPAPYRVLSRHPSYGSELSEASSTQYSTAEAVEVCGEEEASEEFRPRYREPFSSHTEAVYPPYPPFVRYGGMPLPFQMPPDMWLPPPRGDFTQCLPAGYPGGDHEGAAMIPMQDPFGRWVMMPYPGPASVHSVDPNNGIDTTAADALTSVSLSDAPRRVCPAKTNQLVRSASQLRRDRAHRQESTPQTAKSVHPYQASTLPSRALDNQAERPAFPFHRALPPSDYSPLDQPMSHQPLRSQHLHGHDQTYDHSNLSTSTSISAGSLSVQCNHTPLHTHTSAAAAAAAAAALPSMEEGTEIEIDFDAFDFSVGCTPQSAFKTGLNYNNGGAGSGSAGCEENESVFSSQEGSRLFSGLSEELVST